MPTLDWIGKRAVLNHYRTVPYRLLSCDQKLSAGDPDSGNLLVEGDNVEALKALLPYYAGQVKCIYIDPPYNTGKELWAYNDKVDSPEIRSWLGRVVGAEAEDLSRHDKWLCMMYPRVSLLQSFLRRDGVLFVSIDDNELASATFLFDEIFGRRNRVGVIIWKNATDNNPTRISTEHEYVLCYARDIDAAEPVWTQANPPQKQLILDHYEALKSRGLSVEEIQKELRRFIRENREAVGPLSHYDRVDGDGPFTGSRKVHNPGREGYRYDVLHPVTGKPCKEPARGYRYPPETMRELEKSGRLLFGDDESQIIQIKVYLRDYAASLKSVMEIDGRTGANALESIFGNRETFRNPKSVEFVQSLLEFTAKGDDIVLDSFAGSGTTGHAVLAANETDGGSRRFILVELDGNIASTVTATRLGRLVNGYQRKRPGGRLEEVAAVSGGFRYCKLGAALFDEHGHISTEVRFADLAQHIFFTETGQPVPTRTRSVTSPLLGTSNGIAYYLLFNGILGDKRPDGGNILTSRVLADLPHHDGPRVVFGEGCRLGAARLKSESVTFKQIPYQIKT